MPNAAQLRQQIEATLATRVPAALSPRLRVEQETFACGIAELDALLAGGLPAGAITELVGPECSGRTSVALSAVAEMTLAGRVCAWIDVADTLDPESAAANGVDLERLLWVRCGGPKTQPAAPVVASKGLELKPGVPPEPLPVRGGGGSPHPRSEGAGMPEAIERLLETREYYAAVPLKRRDKSIGTPGAPNRPVTAEREEQVATDRLPPRRGEQLVMPRAAAVQSSPVPPLPAPKPTKTNTYTALDQALKTADLLLQAGGFSVIVFDLGSTPAEVAWRIPLATWFRFRAACERTRVSLLLLTQHACARSSAGLVVRLLGGRMQVDSTVLTGMSFAAERERQRFEAAPSNVVSIRKPPQAVRATEARWVSPAAWAEAR